MGSPCIGDLHARTPSALQDVAAVMGLSPGQLRRHLVGGGFSAQGQAVGATRRIRA